MNYQKYQKSRNAAWDILIDHHISELPVHIISLCRKDKIRVISYSRAVVALEKMGFAESMRENDGFAVKIRGENLIFFDDTCSIPRQRFTIAHEYGHFINGDVSSVPTLRNREPSNGDNEKEMMANVMASRILAPICVLRALDVHSPEEIASLCQISLPAAQWRMKRLELLYRRERNNLKSGRSSCFFLSPKERAVYQQFLPFIKSIKG